IAGTAAAVTYPAADETRFTLPSAVHHLDTLTLDYTQPGSDPMLRDTALATGSPAATASGIGVTNDTANVSPSTPTLVNPADTTHVNTATPTLTETGRAPCRENAENAAVEVCSTSNYSS